MPAPLETKLQLPSFNRMDQISKIPEDLRNKIRNKQVMLVVGSGVSSSASGGSHVATWKGLLRAGIDRCIEYGHPPLERASAEKFKEVLNVGDVDNWLAIATLIERKLRYPNSNEWISWIQETVGDLKPKSHALIDALFSLELPIMTTNYDRLLTNATSATHRQILDWDNQSFEKIFLRNPLGYILHLHGSADRPEGVVLGVRSYSRIVSDTRVQSFLRVLLNQYSFLFVGFGSGFDDPNIQPLLDFIGQHGSPNRNYVLVRGAVSDSIRRTENFYPLSYGDKHDFLPSYIRALPFGAERLAFHSGFLQSETFVEFESFRDTAISPEMVFLPGGEVHDDETSASHTVDPIAVSKYGTTLEEWEYFCSEKGAEYRKLIGDKGERDNPIVGITYYDAITYARWLTEITGHVYRLPTETEWKYFAKSGSNRRFWWGDTPDPQMANYRDSKIGTIIPNKRLPQNPFMLHGVLGNTWEWCTDLFDQPDYDADETILKGGCFYYGPEFLDISAKIHLEKDAIFNSVSIRLVREVPAQIREDQSYYIVSRAAPLCISVENEVPRMADFAPGEQNLWRIEPHRADPRKRSIFHVASNTYLCFSPTLNDYEHLRTGDADLETSAWDFSRSIGGHVISPANSNKALDHEGARRRSKKRDLVLFEKHENLNQIWTFISSSQLT